MPPRVDRGLFRWISALQGQWRRLLMFLGIGHRAAFLMGFGAIYGVIGLSVIFSPAPPDALLFHTQLPHPLRLGLWAGSGAVAVMASGAGRWQWVGFLALTPPPLERMFSYGIAVADTMPPGPPVPYPYMNGLALYGLILFVVTLCSSWQDNVGDPKPVFRRPKRPAWLAPRSGGYTPDDTRPKGPPPSSPGAASDRLQTVLAVSLAVNALALSREVH